MKTAAKPDLDVEELADLLLTLSPASAEAQALYEGAIKRGIAIELLAELRGRSGGVDLDSPTSARAERTLLAGHYSRD